MSPSVALLAPALTAVTEWGPDTLTVTEGPWLPSWPTEPPVIDWDAPDPFDPTDVRHVQVAVASIRSFRWRGELLQARIVGARTIGLEGSTVTIEVPTSDPTILATLVSDVEDWGALTTGLLDLVDLAFFPVVAGQVCPPYVARGEARVRDGMITIPCQDATRLFSDRIMGEGQRHDLLEGRGHFPGISPIAQLGITWSGSSSDIEWTSPGVRGGRALRIRGSRLAGDQLRIASSLTESSTVTGQRITVRSSAFFQVPDESIDRTDLMATHVFVGSTRVSPALGAPDPYVAQVTEDTARGEWGRDPETSAGLLPVPPYTAQVVTVIYPQHDTEWTYVSDIEQFRRDTFSSGVDRDLVEHLHLLIREAQTGRGKSSWSLPTVVGDLSGVSELLVVRAEDESPLVEEIARVTERDDGPDPPYVDGSWRVVCTHRRGRVRADVTLSEVDVVSPEGWTHDPGSMASEVRGLTDRGEAYWRVSEVATDTSRTHGHVIERQARAPNDLPLLALSEWTAARLAEVAQPQETTRFVVRGDLARRLEVGDTVRVVLVDGFVRLDRQMRIVQQAWDDASDLCALDLGVDE